MIFQNQPSIWMILREISLMLKIDSRPLKDSGLVTILKVGVFGSQIMSFMKEKAKLDT